MGLGTYIGLDGADTAPPAVAAAATATDFDA